MKGREYDVEAFWNLEFIRMKGKRAAKWIDI